MSKLTILYDATCGLCFMVKQWMMNEAKFVEIEFIAASSPAAFERYPTLASKTPKELIVIDERGGVYRDDDAWLMCLYALCDYRALSLRLAAPALKPLARRAWSFISNHRRGLSKALALESEDAIQKRLANEMSPIACTAPAERGSAERGF